MFRRLLRWLNRPVDPRKGAFLIIKSREGRRTRAHKYISPETYERERARLEKAGIKRIKKTMP